jgi:hypothetical protein
VNTSDTRDLVSNISTNLNISGSFAVQAATVAPSITASTGYNSTQHSDIKTSYLDLLVESGNVYFMDNSKCRGLVNIDPDFLKAFSQLPVDVSSPGIPASWAPFESFFDRWGTHVITQLTYGSRFQQWESTTGSSSDVDKTLAIKACANVEGTGKSFAANGCAGYTSEQKKTALSSKSNSNTVVIGGNDDSRFALQQSITEDNINAFLRASAESNQGVGVQFAPVWVVLGEFLKGDCASDYAADPKTLSDSCKNVQRCLNLEAAFAFRATECQTLGSGGHTYQEFRRGQSIGGLVTYNCFSKKTGCNSKDNCHYDAGAAGCKAYGPDVFDQGAVFGDPSASQYRTAVHGSKTGGIRDGVNMSCSYKAFKGCQCNAGWAGGLPDRYLWQQGMS